MKKIILFSIISLIVTTTSFGQFRTLNAAIDYLNSQSNIKYHSGSMTTSVDGFSYNKGCILIHTGRADDVNIITRLPLRSLKIFTSEKKVILKCIYPAKCGIKGSIYLNTSFGPAVGFTRWNNPNMAKLAFLYLKNYASDNQYSFREELRELSYQIRDLMEDTKCFETIEVVGESLILKYESNSGCDIDQRIYDISDYWESGKVSFKGYLGETYDVWACYKPKDHYLSINEQRNVFPFLHSNDGKKAVKFTETLNKIIMFNKINRSY